jgi:hypothetical protein
MWWLGQSPNHHIYGSLLRARGFFITLLVSLPRSFLSAKSDLACCHSTRRANRWTGLTPRTPVAPLTASAWRSRYRLTMTNAMAEQRQSIGHFAYASAVGIALTRLASRAVL